MPRRSAFADVSAEDRLDVDDRCPIQRFEMAHLHPSTFDRRDLHPVEADRIRAVRRARAEDALPRPGAVPARVYAQDVAAGAIEPGDDDERVAGPDAPESLEHLRLEDEPGLWRAFVGLPGGRFEIGQGGLDPPDDRHLEAGRVFGYGSFSRARAPILLLPLHRSHDR